MSTRRSLWGIGALALAGALVLAGCGGQDGTGTALSSGLDGSGGTATGSQSPSANPTTGNVHEGSAGSAAERLEAASAKSVASPLKLTILTTTDAGIATVSTCVIARQDPTAPGGPALSMSMKMGQGGDQDACSAGTELVELTVVDAAIYVTTSTDLFKITGADAAIAEIETEVAKGVSGEGVVEMLDSAESITEDADTIIVTFAGKDALAAMSATNPDAASVLDGVDIGEMTIRYHVSESGLLDASTMTFSAVADGTAMKMKIESTMTPIDPGGIEIPTGVTKELDGSGFTSLSDLISEVMGGKVS